MKYYTPDDYMNNINFQSASKGDEFTYQNFNDPQGYCLAWCFLR